MKIVVGTRRAQVPLVQSRAVGRLLEQAGVEVEIRPITTVGDTLDVALSSGGPGVFVREVDEALLRNEIDVAVHDAKDLAFDLPQGIAIAAIPARLDPREAFVSTRARKLAALPKGARVGISGPCRGVQLARMRPDLELVLLSGDVEARLASLKAGEVDGIILAAAGLVRLGIGSVITEVIPVDKLIPLAGQGALAVEVRSADREILNMVKKACHHNASGITVRAERGFVRAFAGMEGAVLAANAEIKPSGLFLIAMAATADGSVSVVDHESGPLEEAGTIGTKLAEKMMARLGKA